MKAIRELELTDFLSYAQHSAIAFHDLNVLIGPNASGKSNLIEAFVLLREATKDLAAGIREGGGIAEYVRKGSANASFSMTVFVEQPGLAGKFWNLRYDLTIHDFDHRPLVTGEELHEVAAPPRTSKLSLDSLSYVFGGGEARIRQEVGMGESVLRELDLADLQRDQSILSQRRDPDVYPRLSYLASLFGRIAVYRDWSLGAKTKVRSPQAADLPGDFLLPDASNLALVLHEMLQRSTNRKKLIGYLQRFYSNAQHISTRIQAGSVQLFVEEKQDILVPATRLSDGTLRYLSLLAILCHPSPPPIVCIEEPELGLHPDILPTIAELLLDASQRTQLIVTTHSDALVSALSDTPECIVVCEPGENGTELRRLDKEALSEWLSRYSLGELWRMGEIGGTRW